MADDGRTFFATRDALVPFDTNELLDVYEYVDGPAAADLLRHRPTRTKAFEGRVDAGLSGVSADGINVYFSPSTPSSSRTKRPLR